ncbi:MAG: HNH endonuclease signature motif containing protein [SAR324 cluster bacterium]|nr:HNH endonuclease signature motif containing protein [SAR324 cluster bacterium]MDP6295878.1 HNH endonuclease signature motif containing protein [SAR324 cluster bacterium]|tara:strand:- start:431 stop:847 length:417 start_codon:yes stop_codon:yes gene_type:complete
MANDSRYHPEWETVSRYVRELFNYHCARCEKDCRKTKNAQMVLQVHHIDENPANNALENLIPLCASCHLKIEGEARLHAPYREKQLELFEDHTYMSRMKEMRENALEKNGSEVKPEVSGLDAETYETNAIEWEINDPS